MAIALSGSSSDGHNLAGTSSQISCENKKSAGEMIGGCSVCSDDQGTEENSLVYCDGCELAVHQACYGIIKVPPGSWFCRKCELGANQDNIKCELCPSKDGALKKTETGLWAHVICALYIPEVRFGNNNTMEPIEIKHIQADRYTKVCCLCEENGNRSDATYGAVMNCHKLGCKRSFHVTCAQTAGLLFEEANQGLDNLNYCGYCKHHFRKLKADNRNRTDGSLNNSRSSYFDSASDSSQDNDSRCNTTEYDKNSNHPNKFSTLPTNLSMSGGTATNSHSPLPSSVTTTNKAASALTKSGLNTITPINQTNTGSSGSLNEASVAPSSAQKKKRAPKNGNTSTSATNNSSSTLLATTGSPTNQSCTQSTTTACSTASNQVETKDNSPEDPYNWSSSSKDQIQTNIDNNNGNNNSNKSSKKKPTFSTQTSNLKPSVSSNTQSSITAANLQKIGSPNLSLSTSPSLASPSSSTKSTSNSSTSTTTSSTSSNSPSPALLSPNIPSRGSIVRVESPLASNSKTGSNLNNKSLPESVPSNVTLPIGQDSLQIRNLDNPKIDLKKNPAACSSLLSTATPHESVINNTLNSSQTTSGKGYTNTPTKHSSASTASSNQASSVPAVQESSAAKSGNYVSNVNTQPTVPPLIIPVPQPITPSNSSKSTAKPKAVAKSTRKKSTENNENPKIEPKAKPSRSKKATVSNNIAETSISKPEPKKGKGKVATKPVSDTAGNSLASAAGTVSMVDGDSTSKTQSSASSPAKRKSRSTSDQSSAAPSPIKRQRKKKTDQTTPPSDQSSVTPSNPLTVAANSQLLYPAPNAPVNIGPLMINTPMVNGRLIPGSNSVEGNQDMGNRYFSPMISPYANFDHLTTPSLSRSSLSRLFTSSLADNNQSNPADDLGKAFEELRETTWSHLSKCILEQAQQFDIPSLIGTLYTLRSENEKLVNKVRDLTSKRDQLIAMNARLDLPGPMLTQHLNNTSPNFSSIVSGLTNSPKSLPISSPGSAISKQPLVAVGSYNHVPPTYLDRSSPLVNQTHSSINNIKSSSVSTPSPPIGAIMAHSSNNRAGLITVNPSPYMSNVFPPMNTMTQLGANPQGSSYYPRQ